MVKGYCGTTYAATVNERLRGYSRREGGLVQHCPTYILARSLERE